MDITHRKTKRYWRKCAGRYRKAKCPVCHTHSYIHGQSSPLRMCRLSANGLKLGEKPRPYKREESEVQTAFSQFLPQLCYIHPRPSPAKSAYRTSGFRDFTHTAS